MKTIIAATAILQFIGLCLGVDPNRTGGGVVSDVPAVDFVLPAVPARSSATRAATRRVAAARSMKRESAPAADVSTASVEQHVAMIIFPTVALRKAAGFTVQPFPRMSDYSYVELHGEHLSIAVNGTNDTPHLPQQLAHLAAICKGADTDPDPPLIEGYRAPAYSAAAAVVHVTEGTLKTCAAVLRESETPNTRTEAGATPRGYRQTDRADTHLTLDNDGTLVLSANKVRQLVFDGNATIIVANLPAAYLTGGACDLGAPHYQIYSTMVKTTQRCQWHRLALESCGFSDATSAALRTIWRGDPAVPDFGANARISWECSNSQYP